MNINTSELEIMKTKIELLPKFHQVEILRILKKSPVVKINENKSGVFVNLSFLPNDTIQDILNYVKYIQEQEHTLQTVEYQKKSFKDEFFKQDINEQA
jgi:hypothetical protein